MPSNFPSCSIERGRHLLFFIFFFNELFFSTRWINDKLAWELREGPPITVKAARTDRPYRSSKANLSVYLNARNVSAIYFARCFFRVFRVIYCESSIQGVSRYLSRLETFKAFHVICYKLDNLKKFRWENTRA